MLGKSTSTAVQETRCVCGTFRRSCWAPIWLMAIRRYKAVDFSFAALQNALMAAVIRCRWRSNARHLSRYTEWAGGRGVVPERDPASIDGNTVDLTLKWPSFR